APERLKRFRKTLELIRSRCDLIIESELGKHAGVKHQHEHAAKASLAVLEAAASYAGTELRVSCSPTGRFCQIASLFLEAATGEYNADLPRACEAVASTRMRTKTKK